MSSGINDAVEHNNKSCVLHRNLTFFLKGIASHLLNLSEIALGVLLEVV
jgi:hypothetical protein